MDWGILGKPENDVAGLKTLVISLDEVLVYASEEMPTNGVPCSIVPVGDGNIYF